MRREDEIRLRHMLDAAQEAVSFARGRTRDDLNTNRQLVLSLVMDIAILGEAATRRKPPVSNCPPFRGMRSSPCAIGSFMHIST